MSTTSEAADVNGVGQLVASTSLSDLAFCKECEPPPRPAEVFCPICKVPLCESCDLDTIHRLKALSNHKRMKIKEYRLVDDSLGRSSPTDKQIEADSKNMLCCINPLDHGIVLQPQIASLVPDSDALPSLVAFVGPTGVGKSTVMRLLISLDGRTDEADMPLAGAPQDSLSTTADLHMYDGGQVQTPSQAQYSPIPSTYPLLYVDSEGRGGLKEPRAIHKIWKSFYHIYRERLGKYEDFNKKRNEHVRQSYPRLLYIFSDVLCFVFTGDWREQESILTPLLEWVQSGALGAVNQHRPQLFLILNKRGDEEALKQEYNDFRKTYETWIHGVGDGSREKLERYYSDPQICLIPEGDLSPDMVLQRVKLLRASIFSSTKRIRRSREEANQLFTRRQLQYYMQLAVDSFNKNPTCEFDIYKESMARRPAATGLAECIVEFRRAVSEHANSVSSKKERHKESLKILGGRFKCSVLLRIGRLKMNPLLGPNARLPKDLQKDLKKAQEWMDGDEPCAAVKDNIHRCDTMRHRHGDSLHASRDVRWIGDFTRDPEVEAAVDANNLVNLANDAIRTTTPLNVRTIREQLLQVRGSERDNYPWLRSFISYKACGSCIFELPTEVLSCGHIICAKCAKEEADPSLLQMICPICLSPAQWYPNDLPPLAGYRILSLDGGGIRGIVELLSLKEIMSFFPDMHVEDLFDIIAGTSTGGIIALALTVHKFEKQPKRLGEVMKLFEDLSKSVFSPDMLRPGAEFSLVLRFCQFLRIYDTKYKNDNLLKLLKEHFGEELLLRSCAGGPRVVVTSCARDNNFDAAWFTSYNRPTLENETTQKGVAGRVHDNHIFTPKDAAAATSAAGTYFPAYEVGSQFWVDGGFRYNCPAEVAIMEAGILWPNQKASALISLGCAQLSSNNELRNSDGLRSVVNALKWIVLDAETQSQKAISYLKDIQPDSSRCGIRLNPTIKVPYGEKYELDDAEKIPALKEMTEEYLRGDGRTDIEEAANLLWAAQFYVEVEYDELLLEPKLDMLHIRSRAPLPTYLKAALIAASCSSSLPFSGTVHEAPGAEFEFLWAKCTWKQGIMNLPFKFNGYTLIRSVTVTINLHMCLPRTSAPEGWPWPISGMPWKVSAPGSKNKKKSP